MPDPPPPGGGDGDPPQAFADTVDPGRALRSTLKGLATVVAPTTLITSLLYYFGWARDRRQAALMGFHVSLLEFSSQDYVLQSLAPMFWPLLVGLLASIGGLLLHGAVLLYASRAAPDLDADELEQRRANVRRFAVAVAGLGGLLASAGVFGVALDTPSRRWAIAYPLCLTASIVCAGYAVYLSQRFRRRRAIRRMTPELRGVQIGLSSLVVLLLLLSLFWSVSNYAEIKGGDLAHRVEDDLEILPDVTIYSARRLFLEPPVVETPLGGEDGAYRFRYTGLKLLLKTKSSYWLRPSDDTTSKANIFLAAGPDLRLEFARPR